MLQSIVLGIKTTSLSLGISCIITFTPKKDFSTILCTSIDTSTFVFSVLNPGISSNSIFTLLLLSSFESVIGFVLIVDRSSNKLSGPATSIESGETLIFVARSKPSSN